MSGIDRLCWFPSCVLATKRCPLAFPSELLLAHFLWKNLAMSTPCVSRIALEESSALNTFQPKPVRFLTYSPHVSYTETCEGGQLTVSPTSRIRASVVGIDVLSGRSCRVEPPSWRWSRELYTSQIVVHRGSDQLRFCYGDASAEGVSC